MTHLVPGSDTDATNGRRERRARRIASTLEPLDLDARRAARRARRESSATEPLAAEAVTPELTGPDGAATAAEAQHTDGEAHRTASGLSRSRPRAPRAEKRAADAASAGDGAEPVSKSAGLPEGSAAIAEAVAVEAAGKRPSRGTRTLQRAQRKQHAAAAAVGGAGEHPALGALNRHLNLLTQQVGTAHRVIGRVAAERDALRQQLADLQGIPVEEIVVTSIGASTESADRPARTRGHGEPGEPQPSTGLARFNYFAHEDIQVMRKRRQMAALCILSIVLVLGITSRLGFWQLPSNISRDSLGALPVIGNFMTIFFAGWMFFRVFKIGGKGVKWVFPSDQRRKRR